MSCVSSLRNLRLAGSRCSRAPLRPRCKSGADATMPLLSTWWPRPGPGPRSVYDFAPAGPMAGPMASPARSCHFVPRAVCADNAVAEPRLR